MSLRTASEMVKEKEREGRRVYEENDDNDEDGKLGKKWQAKKNNTTTDVESSIHIRTRRFCENKQLLPLFNFRVLCAMVFSQQSN